MQISFANFYIYTKTYFINWIHTFFWIKDLHLINMVRMVNIKTMFELNFTKKIKGKLVVGQNELN